VQAVNYWGITDQGSWLGAPVGLVRADGSTKPAYDALRGLVKDRWWLPATRLRTDAEGRLAIRGWAGEYGITGLGEATSFQLSPDVDSVEVTLTA
jgi:endo-1,4-beta-xylanase